MRFRWALAVLAKAIIEAVAAVVALVCLALVFCLGMVFLFPPMVRTVRRLTGWTRRLARVHAGMEIATPYLPEPPPPVQLADGWYRSSRTLYRTPRIPAWNDRWKWMIGDPATWRDLLWLVWDPFVTVVLAPALLVAPRIGLRAYAYWCRLLLAPTAAMRLAGQVDHLHRVRSLAMDTQAAEMRRIERDLHDGTQARLVALGMTLGAVEELVDRNPEAAKALLAKARDTSSDTLTELRRLVRGIHPPILAERGLGDAVRALAMDSPLKVDVEVELPQRPQAPVEAAVYFAVSELLANAARHGNAEHVGIDISHNEDDLRVTVVDDGVGGADPSRGSGLVGIERRLSAFDGVLAVSSPPGGPTTATMSVPTVLSGPWPWAKLPKMPRWKLAVVIVAWTTAWLPMFPQGIVPGIMKIFGNEDKVWFLALHLPEPWQWPTIIAMTVLGTGLYTLGFALPAAYSETSRSSC
ncbi:sensor histidine kinase [Nonomuraea longicatena]